LGIISCRGAVGTRLLKKAASFFDWILDSLSVLIGAITLIVMFSVCVNVIMRYAFNRPIMGVEEITEHLLVFITFFGSAWLLRKEGHVKVDVVLVMLNRKTQACLELITSVLGIAVCVTMIWYGWKVTWVNFVEKQYFPTILELPKAPVLAFIPLGSLLLLVQFIRRSAINLREMMSSEKTESTNGFDSMENKR